MYPLLIHMGGGYLGAPYFKDGYQIQISSPNFCRHLHPPGMWGIGSYSYQHENKVFCQVLGMDAEENPNKQARKCNLAAL